MKVTQIASILNDTIIPEFLGEHGDVQEDLSNIVDIGKDISSALTADGMLDNYVKTLINRIGREIYWNRPYISAAPNILRDSWEYGSLLMKVRAELPEYTTNDTWTLTAGQSYAGYTYTPPEVSAKLYNDRVAFEIDVSFAERQVRESFSSAEAIGAFFGMIETAIDTSMTAALDSLAMRTINMVISDRIANSQNVVNLLTMYNSKFSQTLTGENCVFDKDFLRFASYEILLYKSRLRQLSKQFNKAGHANHTPADKQRLILLSDFAKGADIYLQSDTYHEELVQVGDYYDVSAWQSTQGFSWVNISTINTKHGSNEVNQTGVIGVLMDYDAAAICCENRRVTSQYSAKGEFYNNFYKADLMACMDANENAVVFIADTPAGQETKSRK